MTFPGAASQNAGPGSALRRLDLLQLRVALRRRRRPRHPNRIICAPRRPQSAEFQGRGRPGGCTSSARHVVHYNGHARTSPASNGRPTTTRRSACRSIRRFTAGKPLGGVINEYYRAAQPSQRTRRSESTRHVSERYKVAGQVFAGGAPSGFSRIQIAWCADSLVHIPASSRGPSLRLHIIATTDQRPGPKVRYCRDPRPMTCTSRRC